MHTESSTSKPNQHKKGDIKYSKTNYASPEVLKEIFKSIDDSNLEELNSLLLDHELADKSLNIALSKAFEVYKPNNRESKEIIGKLLNLKADPNLDLAAKRGVPLKKESNNCFTGIMKAAIENDLYLAEILINYNCNINLKDHMNRNALFYAINFGKEGNFEMVNLLLNNGIEVNNIDSEGLSPLILAVQNGNKDIVNLLLLSDANVDHQVMKDGNSALHYSVSNNKPDILLLLLSKFPNINLKNKKDQTALDLAVNLSRTEIYQILAEESNQRDQAVKKKEIFSTKCENFNEIDEQKEDEDNNPRSSMSTVNTLTNSYLSMGIFHSTSIKNQKSTQPHNSDKNQYYMNGINPQNGILSGNNKLYNDNFKNQTYNENITSAVNFNMNHVTSSQKNGIPFSYKSTKLAKLQKLFYLQKKHPNKNSRNTIRNKMFKFQFGEANNSTTNIEIPFNFQLNTEGKVGEGSNSKNGNNKGNQLHTFIKIKNTPILHIDISDDSKQDQFILSSIVEEQRVNNMMMGKRLNQLEFELVANSEENNALRMELNKMREELNNKDKIINGLTNELNNKEADFSCQIENYKSKLADNEFEIINLNNKYDMIQKELFELVSKESYLKQSYLQSHQEIPKLEYLEKKFSCLKYDEKYIIKSLQKDILDFQEYTKEQIQLFKCTQEELVRLIQESVNECMPDYEVRLYGSHATNLCLQWSDLDVVLIHKKNYNATNYQALQSLYLNLIDKPWKKQLKLIDSAVVPLIKMTSTEQYNNMHIDISLQDSKHYGLKCVELVKSFMKEYEALEPLIFALKNILKNANLNDPFTGGLSSYGLILMVVSFLQSQQENKKSLKIADGNLGRMFLEFLWYYGLIFDHSKYVIYAYPTNETPCDKDSMNFLYNLQTSHELIIVDPLSKNNNVARSTYQFVNIKMAFMIGFVVAHEECECGCHYNKLCEDNNIYNIDHCILKRIFNSVKRFNTNTSNKGDI